MNQFATVHIREQQTGWLSARLWMLLAVLFTFYPAYDGTPVIGAQAPGRFGHSSRFTREYRYDGIALFASMTVLRYLVIFLKTISCEILFPSKLTGFTLNTTATMPHDSRSFHWSNSPEKIKNIVVRAMEYSYDDTCHAIGQSTKNSTIRRKKQAK